MLSVHADIREEGDDARGLDPAPYRVPDICAVRPTHAPEPTHGDARNGASLMAGVAIHR
jgi:hypothetical protein